MKKIRILFFFFISTCAFAQKYSGYSDDTLKFESKFLNDSITLNLHLPETLKFASSSTKYPITIIFDSQHERTYPHIVNSIDLLTNESQMPETIIVGVPFNHQNRYYLTSGKKIKNDSLSGIERMNVFIFDELIPKLQKEYKANGHLTIVGHSRTGFLVNYLTINNSDNIDVAIALSGFYNSKPVTIESFKSFISNDSNFPNECRYYFTAGSTLEEEPYLEQYNEVWDFISKNNIAVNFKALFVETHNANHMSNYWISLPSIFVDVYSDYNNILNDWFYVKLKKDTVDNPVEEFQSDLKKTSKKTGIKINPSLTQIFSLASSYAYNKNDFKTAIDFIKLGQEYYSDYADFDLSLIGYYESLENHKLVEYQKAEYRNKVNNRKDLNKFKKAELLKNIE